MMEPDAEDVNTEDHGELTRTGLIVLKQTGIARIVTVSGVREYLSQSEETVQYELT